ncbi:PDE9A [Symbiodinium natans]|uniref:Phosphodiesterase n=1 Tax=Symbiodinium natans TaxID=878477 RepID=A0A812RST0_9DINO|nr:PDE9A [Symbiodinium natans]
MRRSERSETAPLLKGTVAIAQAHQTLDIEGNFSNRPGGPSGPSTLYEISLHRSRKRTLEKGFDARGSFVHFAHRHLKSAVQFQDVLDRPGVRGFLYRSKWYRRPSVMRLRNFMTGTFVTFCSFASLLIALFCSDVYAFLGASDSTQSDVLLSIAFVFFVLEFLGNALSDKTYLLSFFFFMDFLGTFSMVFDISYLCGADVTAFDRLDLEAKGGSGVMIVRAARAARVGTRAGRLSRVAKIVRFLSGVEDISTSNVKMAKVISNKLSDVLSIRIAFVVIIIAVVFPSFSIFEYPAMEESMSAWTNFLAHELVSFRQGSSTQLELDGVVRRMSSFYRSVSYGPFLACFSEHNTSLAQELLDCRGSGNVRLEFDGVHFSRPTRGEFLLVTSAGKLDVFFDMSAPRRLEAVMAISLIAFSIVAMLVFGTFLSENISTVAIAPMERMLAVVRHRCAQIFKYTAELQEVSDSEAEDSEHEHESEEFQSNEFELLEKAVSKLSAIASLSAADAPKETEPLNEDDLLVMNWTHGRGFITYEVDFGVQAASVSRVRSHHVSPKDVVGIELLYQQVPSEMLTLSRTEDFNPMEPTSSQKKALCAIHLLDNPGCKDFVRGSINPTTLLHFVDTAEANYSPVPFHNFGHSLDVLCTLSLQMEQTQAPLFLTNVEQFGLLVAAVGHDLGHPGLNNPFLVETRHEVAVTYNDRSPLENMHCAKLFHILREPDTNVFYALDKETYKELRKDLIEAILHTDVTKHNEMVKDLALFYQMNSDTLSLQHMPHEVRELLQSNRSGLMNGLLHSADVNNPAKPWHVAKKLAYLCMDEFFAQGDREKELEIPVGMLNDRDKVNRANSQIGFIEFMIAPFIEALVSIFPGLDDLAANTSQNIENWARLWQAEASPPPEQVEKVAVRVQKVVAKLDVTCKTRLQGAPAKDFGDAAS